jgi:putative transposase
MDDRRDLVRRSKSEVFLHFVWCTQGRYPFLTPIVRRPVYRCIMQEARRLGLKVLAFDGMPDHCHLLALVPPRLAPAVAMRQIKGVSSRFAAGEIPEAYEFRWQEHYGVTSVSRGDLPIVVAYIRGQRFHHMKGTTHDEWEETSEMVDIHGELDGEE